MVERAVCKKRGEKRNQVEERRGRWNDKRKTEELKETRKGKRGEWKEDKREK